MTEQTLKAANQYLERDWYLIQLKPNSKKPTKYKWTETKITGGDISSYFDGKQNIAVALGDRSNGLVDLDFDNPDAASIGNIIFGEVPGFGRLSSPVSHRIVNCESPGKIKQFGLTPKESQALGFNDSEKTMILEVRSNGGYTMFPPSIHPSGEQLQWIGPIPDVIPSITWEELQRRAGLCAFLAIILRSYPSEPGQRSNICMALTGALLRADLNPEEVDRLVVSLADLKNDEEANSRSCAEGTQAKMQTGSEVTGLPTLCELLGLIELKDTLHKWLYGTVQTQDTVDEIAMLNEQFFVVSNEGGKCRVAFFEEQTIERGQKRHVLYFQSFPDFRNRHMNQKILVPTGDDGKLSKKSLGDYWLHHSDRRQYDRIDFRPGDETPANILNLWQGFSVAPERGSWRHMQRHVWQILADRDRKAYRYIMRWAAWSVQNPGEPAEVALVFRGGRGTGKGTFCRWLKNLFGQHGLQIFSSRLISGRFNSPPQRLRALVCGRGHRTERQRGREHSKRNINRTHPSD